MTKLEIHVNGESKKDIPEHELERIKEAVLNELWYQGIHRATVQVKYA